MRLLRPRSGTPSAGGGGLSAVNPHRVNGLLALCAQDSVGSLALAHQVRRWSRWSPGDVVALGGLARPDAVAWTTGSVIPFGLAPRPGTGHRGASPAQVGALAEHARPRLGVRGSVYGPAVDVEPLWRALVARGLRARQERWNQPLLVAPAPVEGLGPVASCRYPGLAWAARALRAASVQEEELVLPASVAMFTAELGYDPLASGGGYARHVAWLVAQRRSYVVLDDGQGAPPRRVGPRAVAFKADVGALWSPLPGRDGGVAQLTGVWTRPDLRGRGLGSIGLAATVDAVRREHVGREGVVSLYVNDFNIAALGMYRGLGFQRVGTYATILL